MANYGRPNSHPPHRSGFTLPAPTIKNPDAPANPKQINYLRNLAKEREIGMDFEDFEAMLEALHASGATTMGWVSPKIEEFKALPKRLSVTGIDPVTKAYVDLNTGVITKARPQVEPGYYTRDGQYYVVVKTKDGERTYAKQLTPPAPGKVRWTWEYVKGAVITLAGMVPLTLEEAAQWGHLNGHCIICGARLDDPKSVQAGIGPTCQKKVKR